MHSRTATSARLPVSLDLEHRRWLVGGQPMVFHCHEYSAFLHRSLLNAGYVDTRRILVGAGAEVAYAQLTALFEGRGGTGDNGADRLALANAAYRWTGLGAFDLTALNEAGGTIRTSHSHYARAWNSLFGRAQAPVCHFAAGWLAGALAAIHGRPLGCYTVHELECAAASDATECIFRLEACGRGAAHGPDGCPSYEVYSGVGAGYLTKHAVRPEPPHNVRPSRVVNAVIDADVVLHETGTLSLFGVPFVRHYANYCNRVTFEFFRAATAKFGAAGREAVEPLLVEAGHVCAFGLLGGLATSPEWDLMIRPALNTREDWVHALAAAVNAFGWGRWQVVELSADEALFAIHDDYESVGHLAMYGRAKTCVSYLARGAGLGIMNLVYVGNIATCPKLNRRFRERLFRGGDSYRVEVLESKAMGDEITLLRVFVG